MWYVKLLWWEEGGYPNSDLMMDVWDFGHRQLRDELLRQQGLKYLWLLLQFEGLLI